MIKAVRALTGLGLERSERSWLTVLLAPLKEGVSKEDAEEDEESNLKKLVQSVEIK